MCYNIFMFKWAKWFEKDEVESVTSSPNNRIECKVIMRDSHLVYEVYKDKKPIIKRSNLGLRFSGEETFSNHLKLVRSHTAKCDETFPMLWGEEDTIVNRYNETAYYFAENKGKKRLFTLRVRVFDEGVAFRYEIPAQPSFQSLVVADELTEFNVDLNTTAWKIPAYQPDRYEYNYEKCPIYALEGSAHTPFTMRTENGYYLAIHEAALYDYGSMNVKLSPSRVLQSDITPLSDKTKAHVKLPFQTPWRVLMIASSAIELTKNRMIYCLNDPPKQDFSWVKTLKFIGIWWAMYVGEWTWAPGERHGATTLHAKEYIEAAVRLGIQGVLIEGWNEGWEGDWLENGIHNKFTVSTPDFDLPEVARFASSKGVEIVGHHETVGFIDNYESQLEEAYNYYAANGVHYIKTGYAGSMMLIHGRREFHHSQVGVNHYQKTIELAARKKIMLDIHEPIKGTGIERTWPNLLSREGARGQEYEGGALSPSHACYLPYTRLLAGGMDYTNGIFDITNSVKRISTTLARQLAYFVTIYSGMAMAADRPYIYEERFPKAFEFIRDVPTNFRQTIPIAGEIGEYYVVARQSRDGDWYLGGVANEHGKRIHIPLEFIGDGVFKATLFLDAENAHYRDNPFAIDISERHVGKTDSLDIMMAPGGGFAVKLSRTK